MGSVNCTKAVWEPMRSRTTTVVLLFTTSSSGLYGNFGQSNYSAAKMALVGLMQTLALEGERHNIRVNCLAPSAATADDQRIILEGCVHQLGPELVSPAVVALASADAPTRKIVLAGAGYFEQANVTMTRGALSRSRSSSRDNLLLHMDDVASREGEMVPANGGFQYQYEIERALAATGWSRAYHHRRLSRCGEAHCDRFLRRKSARCAGCPRGPRCRGRRPWAGGTCGFWTGNRNDTVGCLYRARLVTIEAGMRVATPSITVNRLCGSRDCR